METQRMVCRASVWPHRHTDELCGPLDLKISYRYQPPVVRDWPKKKPILIHLEQPNERTNLTIMKLSFDYGPWSDEGWYNINQYRIHRDNSLTCYIKTRITNQMEHPIPVGRYEGVCSHSDRHCLFTFQAMTMKVQPQEQRIALPDSLLPVKKGGKTRIILP